MRVRGLRVHRADDPAVTMGVDTLTRVHRFFGDSDGDSPAARVPASGFPSGPTTMPLSVRAGSS